MQQQQQQQQVKKPDENQSQMQSSAGFRSGMKMKISQSGMRPGSKDGSRKLQTGEIFPNLSEIQTNTYQLSVMNMFQDEMTFCSSLQFDLQNLQNQINQCDIDGKFRNSEKSDFAKPYVQQTRKWLQQHSNKNIQSIIDSKMNQPIDQQKLVESLNQKNAGDALVKLYKLTQILEMMIVKTTELEAIHFLRYDDHYNELCQVESMSSTQNQTLEKISSQGIVMSRFALNLANIERSMDFIQSASKMNQSISNQKSPQGNSDTSELEARLKKVIGDNQLLQKLIKQKDIEFGKEMETKNLKLQEQNKQIQTLIEKQAQSDSKSNQMQTETQETAKNGSQEHAKEIDRSQKEYDSQIKTLKNQIVELKEKYSEVETKYENSKQLVLNLERQLADLQKQSQKQDVKPPTNNSEAYIKLIDEAKKEYDTKVKSLQNEIMELRSQSLEIQIKYENFKQLAFNLEKQVTDLQQINDEIYKRFALKYLNKEDYANSYEAAMKLEFDTMKRAFQKKIDQLAQDCDQLKRENLKNQSQMRKELEKEQETKKLLMNKLSLYMQ